MGCLLAGKIALSGNNVLLLDHRQERASTINQKGLTIQEQDKTLQVRVPVTWHSEDLTSRDLIINCVKAYDTRTVAQALKRLGKTPYLLTLQNGVGNVEILGDYLPKQKVLAGITSHGATNLGSGQVRHAGEGDTFIGYGFSGTVTDPEGDPTLNRIKDLLSAAGFTTRLVPRIENLIWSKLLVNVGINALTALTRLPNGKLLHFPGTERILEEAVQEGLLVGKEKGIEFIYADQTAQVKKVCRLTETNISSMLQDVLKKKRTEIDFINGVIVREGERYRIPVPVNTLLTGLIKTIEQAYDDVVPDV
jgi:2-dehydropantoate 2-reductase